MSALSGDAGRARTRAQGRRAKGDGGCSQRPGGSWETTIELPKGPDGRRRRKTFSAKTEADALRKAREFRGRLERGETVATARQTVAAYFEAWIEGALRTSALAGQRSEGTAENYEDVYRSTIAKILGPIRLDRLSADDIDRMTVTLSQAGYSQNSMRLARTVLGVALKDAVRRGLISRNPVELSIAPTKRRPNGEPAAAVRAPTALGTFPIRRDRREAPPVPLR